MFEPDNKRLVPPSYEESNPIDEIEFKPQVPKAEGNTGTNVVPPGYADVYAPAFGGDAPHPPVGHGGRVDAEDPLGPEVKGFDFDDKSIRRNFIRKVYAILLAQLAVTIGCICLGMYEQHVKLFVRQHTEVFYVAVGLTLFLVILMSCVSEIRRKSPANYIFLFLITFALAYTLGVMASMMDSDVVLLAVGITAVVCIGLTLFAFQTKWDFTLMGGALFTVLIILIVFGFAMIFIPGRTAQILYSSAGALIFSLYIIYDTQLMMGGEHKFSISPEEYIFAALNLYLDVINLFLMVLRLLSNGRS